MGEAESGSGPERDCFQPASQPVVQHVRFPARAIDVWQFAAQSAGWSGDRYVGPLGIEVIQAALQGRPSIDAPQRVFQCLQFAAVLKPRGEFGHGYLWTDHWDSDRQPADSGGIEVHILIDAGKAAISVGKFLKT